MLLTGLHPVMHFLLTWAYGLHGSLLLLSKSQRGDSESFCWTVIAHFSLLVVLHLAESKTLLTAEQVLLEK